jgi:TolB-like protein/Flp pilus assembly protein TadD
MSLIAELKRRNVFRVAVLYLVAGWLVLQVGDVVFPALGVPEWGLGLVLGLLILGFPIALIFSWIFELTPEGIKRERDIDPGQSVTAHTGEKINLLIIVLLLVAIGVVVADRLLPETPAPATVVESPVSAPMAPMAGSGEDGPAPGPAGSFEEADDPAAVAAGMFMTTAPEKSVAVLPFVNMSGDPENAFFSDGLSEELLNVLAKVPDLFVAARTSSFHFKGHTGDIADIARQLRVRNVLEGSVRKSGDRVRITAQLIDASNGYHLWSDTYDRRVDDVFAVQDEISTRVAEALKVALFDGAENTLQQRPTDDIDAYLAYLKGQQHIRDGGVAGYENAAAAFEQAVALDPDFAEAYAAIGIAWGSALDWGNTSWQVGGPPLRAAADRALALDDNLAHAWVADGLARAWQDADSRADPEVLDSLERAYRLAPDDVEVTYWYAVGLNWQGRAQESIEPLQRALIRDPLSPRLNAQLGVAQRDAGNLDAARESYRRVTELSPGNPLGPDGIASIERSRSRVDQAVLWQYRTLEADQDDTFSASMIATDYANLDDLERAEQWLAVAAQMDANAAMTRYARAYIALAHGDLETATEIANQYFADDLGGLPGPSDTWMETIRYESLLSEGKTDAAIELIFEEHSPDDRIDTTTSARDVYRYVFAMSAIRMKDGTEAERLTDRILALADRSDARLGVDDRAAIRCTLRGNRGDAAGAVAACREHQRTSSFGRIFLETSSLFEPVRDDPAWVAFLEELRLDAAEDLSRLRGSGEEPTPARPLPAAT